VTVVWIALAACTGPAGQGGPDGVTDSGGPGPGPGGKPDTRLDRDHWSDRTNGSGRLKIELDVPEDVVSFQITGDSDLFVSFDTIVDPKGKTVFDYQDWATSSESLTLAFVPQRRTTALDWPVRGKDGPLKPGVWEIWLATTNSSYYYIPNIDVDLVTELKYDADPTSGDVNVQIVFADGVDRNQEVVDAVEEATERWAEVWAKAGLTLHHTYTTSDLDPEFSFVYSGSDDVTRVAKEKSNGDLQLIVGEVIANDDYIFGLSAGIPGTVEATPNSFVLLSWLAHAGRDGEFDNDEIRLMGETMAHECGHYTGLFHPVEFGYDAWDALEDTEQCTRLSDCIDQLGSNLMFPAPICDFTSCDPQGAVTDEQAEVMNQYVGAL
jgi:hypothetical protein